MILARFMATTLPSFRAAEELSYNRRLVADHGRTGAIVLERVTQRFPVPREEREFTAVNALVKANKLITSSSGEELARLLPKEISGDPKLYAESFASTRGKRFHRIRSSAATAWRESSRPCAPSTSCRPA